MALLILGFYRLWRRTTHSNAMLIIFLCGSNFMCVLLYKSADLVIFPRFFFILAIGLSILIGFGLEELWGLSRNSNSYGKRQLVGIIFAILVVILWYDGSKYCFTNIIYNDENIARNYNTYNVSKYLINEYCEKKFTIIGKFNSPLLAIMNKNSIENYVPYGWTPRIGKQGQLEKNITTNLVFNRNEIIENIVKADFLIIDDSETGQKLCNIICNNFPLRETEKNGLRILVNLKKVNSNV